MSTSPAIEPAPPLAEQCDDGDECDDASSSTSSSTSAPPYSSSSSAGWEEVRPDLTTCEAVTSSSTSSPPPDPAIEAARKAAKAVAGGTLVAVGAVLTPLPTPGGILLMYGGMSVLGSEFPGVQRAVDKAKPKAQAALEAAKPRAQAALEAAREHVMGLVDRVAASFEEEDDYVRVGKDGKEEGRRVVMRHQKVETGAVTLGTVPVKGSERA